MKPHEERVVNERNELEDKLNKLDSFTKTEFFKSLDPLDQQLLYRQRLIMSDYVFILSVRIGRF